jgi:hypothetical protein
MCCSFVWRFKTCAQGGIIYKAPDENEPALLAADIHTAGAGECSDPAVQLLATEVRDGVESVARKFPLVLYNFSTSPALRISSNSSVLFF